MKEIADEFCDILSQAYGVAADAAGSNSKSSDTKVINPKDEFKKADVVSTDLL